MVQLIAQSGSGKSTRCVTPSSELHFHEATSACARSPRRTPFGAFGQTRVLVPSEARLRSSQLSMTSPVRSFRLTLKTEELAALNAVVQFPDPVHFEV